MIYEKRGISSINVQTARASFNKETSKASISVLANGCEKQKDTSVQVPVILPKRIRKIRRIRARRKGFAKFALVCATLFFCVTTLDRKYNDGKLADFATDYIKQRYRQIIDKDVKDVYKQELYTLSKYKFTENNDVVKPLSKQELPQSMKENETSDTSVQVTASIKTSVNADGETFYPITTADLSATSVTDLNNNTCYTPDMEKISQAYPLALEDYEINENEPLVLLVHTHACESYTEFDGMYPESESSRTEDTQKNVVRVGEEIAHTLESYGINTIHCTRLCDKESFIDAYNVSHDVVKEYLEKYPSIRVVVDVHRDAIIKDSGESIKPTVNIGGQDYAQLMFVVGTGQTAHSHPDWEENLSLATCVQKEGMERYPGLFRTINLRAVPFNQWLSCGYLLLEVGSNSNSLDEALASGQAFAHILSAVLNQHSQN
ncbi:MAG: stage II sporulation protein P [Clostridia bacterium]|nr:stage II sporulation protein P [Clostridia bacterium]